jgi:hypothetical protein
LYRYSAVYFLTYDVIRRACDVAVGAEFETAGIVLAGGSAGVVQWVVTYPLVGGGCTSRIQLMTHSARKAPGFVSSTISTACV